MATLKSIPPTSADVVTHSHPRDAIDHQDVVETKARQLRALLENTYGGGGEAFRGLNEQLQDHYMWACADMADEIVKSLDALSNLAFARREADGVNHG